MGILHSEHSNELMFHSCDLSFPEQDFASSSRYADFNYKFIFSMTTVKYGIFLHSPQLISNEDRGGKQIAAVRNGESGK